MEQTSSGVLPLAALRGLIKEELIPNINLGETDKFLESGVNRLMSMQTESGGFGYWPGNTKPHEEGTLYAMAALTVAKLNGFDVPEKPLEKAISFLKKNIYSINYNPYNLAFANYILSLNGALDSWGIERNISSYSNINYESQYFWLLADHHSKNYSQGKSEKIWEENKPSHPFSRVIYGDFQTQYRGEAIALLAATAYSKNEKLLHIPGQWG